MASSQCFVEVSHKSLNKKGEELCGDKVEIFQSDTRTIIVLADGLGSGVKANILATLTSKIAITMLKKGADIEEVIETIAHTLPVCKVRNMAYSTFTIIEVDDQLRCKIFESENPPFFFLRKDEILIPDKKEVTILDKTIELTELQLEEDDIIYICSDGVIHAGVGQTLNFGWQWEHVAQYMKKKSNMNARFLCQRLIKACDELYEGQPGDDTTIVTLKVRQPVQVLLFTGPPLDPGHDHKLVEKFIGRRGKKIICGGTAANIVSRELNREIKTSLNYVDTSLPPTAFIDGIDLVTEGVLTLKRTIEMIEKYQVGVLEPNDVGEDGASQLFDLLISYGTHIEFWVGKAINTAHQIPDFPKELSIKMNLVEDLCSALQSVGKEIKISYISEVTSESI